MLGGLADDRAVPSAIASDAGATLVDVLISEGKLAEADRRLRELRPQLNSDEFDSLRRKLASAWIKAGELARADSTIAADSSVEGLALSGRVRLYQGDIRARSSGSGPRGRTPATGRRPPGEPRCSRCCSPSRPTAIPSWGMRCSCWSRATPPRRAARWSSSASALPPQQGGAELNLLAGRLLLARGRRRRRAAVPGRGRAGGAGHRARGRAGAGRAADRQRQGERGGEPSWSI